MKSEINKLMMEQKKANEKFLDQTEKLLDQMEEMLNMVDQNLKVLEEYCQDMPE